MHIVRGTVVSARDLIVVVKKKEAAGKGGTTKRYLVALQQSRHFDSRTD
jgi:polyphosphate kinase 2 (PPK2 family)